MSTRTDLNWKNNKVYMFFWVKLGSVFPYVVISFLRAIWSSHSVYLSKWSIFLLQDQTMLLCLWQARKHAFAQESFYVQGIPSDRMN